MKNNENTTFIVGEIFPEYSSDSMKYLFDEDFHKKIWEPSKNRKVDLKNFVKITEEYTDSEEITEFEHMLMDDKHKDLAIQLGEHSEDDEDELGEDEEAELVQQFSPMSFDAFWNTMYLLFYDPARGKELLNYKLVKDDAYTVLVEMSPGNAYAVSFSQRGRPGGKRFWHMQCYEYISTSLLYNGHRLILEDKRNKDSSFAQN